MLKSKKFWAITLGSSCSLCILACIAFLTISGLGKAGYNALAFNSRVGIGQAAPDFDAETLTGEKIKLSRLQNKPVILSFSATWCPDCQREVPLLQNIHEEHSDIEMVLVDSKEDSQLVQSFADSYGLTFPIALDQEGVISDRYCIYAIPSVFFIDKEGIIQARLIEIFDRSQLDKALASIGVE